MLKYDLAKQLQKLQPKKEHFSIRKLSVGAASVLIGFSFLGLANSQVVKADAGQPETVETIGKSVSASHAVLDRQQTIKSDVKSNESLEDQKSAKQINNDSGLNDHRIDQGVVKKFGNKKAMSEKNLKNQIKVESASLFNKKDIPSKKDAVKPESKIKNESVPTSSISSASYSTSSNNYHKTNDGSPQDPEINLNKPVIDKITWINYGYGNKPLQTIIYERQSDGSYKLISGIGFKDAHGDIAPDTITAGQIKTVWEDGYVGNSDASNFPQTGTGTSLAKNQWDNPNAEQQEQIDKIPGNSKARIIATFGDEIAKIFNINGDDRAGMWFNVYSNYYGATATVTIPDFEQNQDISNLTQEQYRQFVNIKDLEQDGWNGVNVNPNDSDLSKGKKFYMTWAPGKQPSTSTVAKDVPGVVRINFNDGTWLDINVKININKDGSKKVIETKDVIRTINVHNPGGRINTTEQVVKFERSNTINDITQEVISYGNWERALGSAKDWPEFIAPVIDGYTADPASVAEKEVNPDTQNETVDIYYHENNNGGGNQPTPPNPNPTPQPTSPAPEPKPQTQPTKPNNGGKKSNPNTNNVKPKATNTKKDRIHSTRTISRSKAQAEHGLRRSMKGLTKIKVLPQEANKVRKLSKGDMTTQNKINNQGRRLPQTGQKQNSASIFGLALAGLAGLFGLAGDRKQNKR